MPYIYPDVDSLLNQPLVGSGTCVDLIKAYVPGLKGKTTLAWKAGVNVLEAFMAGKPIRRGRFLGTDLMNRRGVSRGLRMTIVGAISCALCQTVAATAAVTATAPYRVECPAVLPPAEVKMRSTTDGWTSTAAQRWTVDGSGMLHGKPDGEGYLAPTSAETRKSGARSTAIRRWTFDIPHQNETWVYCAYGPVELARPIPADATECTVTVTFDGKRRGPTIFECK